MKHPAYHCVGINPPLSRGFKVLSLPIKNRELHLQEMIISAGTAQELTDPGFFHFLGLCINWKKFGNLESKLS